MRGFTYGGFYLFIVLFLHIGLCPDADLDPMYVCIFIHTFIHSFIHYVFLNMMIILRKPHMAELIEVGSACKSYVIFSKNKAKAEYCCLEVGFSGKERETKKKPK